MQPEVWHSVAGSIRAGHAAGLQEDGLVMAPQVMAFRRGQLQGVAHLRPVRRGSDAVAGIAALGILPASARADEIVASWESADLAEACGYPRIDESCLNVLWAKPGRHALYRLPYQERAIGTTDHGTYRVQPRWSTAPRPEVDAPLPAAIRALLEQCWDSGDPAVPDLVLLDRGVDVLTGAGYRVRLAVS